MPAVLQGALPTASGFGRLPAVESTVVEGLLTGLVGQLPAPVVVHCCAGAGQAYARTAMAHVREAAKYLLPD